MIVQVSGPPCAGKSTYIRRHAQPFDVVVDDNELLGKRYGRHRIPGTAWAAYYRYLDQLLASWQPYDPRTLWYVRGNPAPRHPAARVVLITAPPAELYRRAQLDRRPPHTLAWVRQWLDKYGHDNR